MEPIQERAEWARSPAVVQDDPQGALAAALNLAVGGLQEDREVALQPLGVGGGDLAEAVEVGGDLFVVVEDEGEVAVGLRARWRRCGAGRRRRTSCPSCAAAPQDAVLVEPRGEVVGDRHGVDVAGEDDPLAAAEVAVRATTLLPMRSTVRCGRARRVCSMTSASGCSVPLTDGKSTRSGGERGPVLGEVQPGLMRSDCQPCADPNPASSTVGPVSEPTRTVRRGRPARRGRLARSAAAFAALLGLASYVTFHQVDRGSRGTPRCRCRPVARTGYEFTTGPGVERGDDLGGRHRPGAPGARGDDRARDGAPGVRRCGTSSTATGTRSACSSSGPRWAGERRAQIMDPVYSAGKFYEGLEEGPGLLAAAADGGGAEECRRAVFPTAYAKHEPDATLLSAALTGRAPAALICTASDVEGLPPGDPVKVRTELVRAFGEAAAPKVVTGGSSAGRSATEPPVLVVPVRATADGGAAPGAGADERRGWELAQWAVARADELRVARESRTGAASGARANRRAAGRSPRRPWPARLPRPAQGRDAAEERNRSASGSRGSDHPYGRSPSRGMHPEEIPGNSRALRAGISLPFTDTSTPLQGKGSDGSAGTLTMTRSVRFPPHPTIRRITNPLPSTAATSPTPGPVVTASEHHSSAPVEGAPCPSLTRRITRAALLIAAGAAPVVGAAGSASALDHGIAPTNALGRRHRPGRRRCRARPSTAPRRPPPASSARPAEGRRHGRPRPPGRPSARPARPPPRPPRRSPATPPAARARSSARPPAPPARAPRARPPAPWAAASRPPRPWAACRSAADLRTETHGRARGASPLPGPFHVHALRATNGNVTTPPSRGA
ncbi:hypothetical protein LSPH26S_02211 [Lysinibacillus sphaericus]